MRCSWQLAVSLIVLIAFSVSARAQPELDYHPGIIGKDDRRILDSVDHPWGSIGQVNVTGYRMYTLCTGTLIAPKLVLTAAHCLMDHWKGKPHPAHTVHFLAGVRRDKSLGHSTAKCVRFPKAYRYVGPERIFPDLPFQSVPFEHFNLDIAIIVLAERIPVDPIPLAEGMGFEEMPLIHASYPGDRRFLLSGDFGCRLISTRDGAWGTSCDTHPGSSGGPILVEQGDEIRVAAVMVGTIERLLTLAVPITEWKDLSLDEDCP